MDYVLGSTSDVKVTAMRGALQALGSTALLHSVSAASGVAAQPVGAEETLRGARTRARNALVHHPSAIAVGVENGMREVDGHWEDWAIIVAISPEGQEWVAESAAVPFPLAAVQEARRRGLTTTTVGAVLKEWHGIPEHNPHSFLTQGAQSREDLLRETLTRLLTEMESAS